MEKFKYLIQRQKRLFLLVVAGVFHFSAFYAQTSGNIPISGIVKDPGGETLPGASIVVKGTTIGTTTNIDGNFQLNVPERSTLVISFVGFATKEIDVNSDRFFDVVLEEDAKMLDEVVVIGYGTVRKSDATGSITAIKPDEMNKGLVTNAQDMLVGKIAGVNITTHGGTPGGGATIRIRGGSSLAASNDPLIVIDGLAMDNDGIKGVANPLSMVNPNDIESFTVLKDASATAIYGSRASNGVIIITTKKGSADSKPRISYAGNVSAGILTNRLEVMNADRYRNYITERFPVLADRLGNANTDWQDEVYRTVISTDHNISVAGGMKNVPYRVSAGYTNQNGIIRTSGMERITGAVNLSPAFFDKHLTFNVNVKGMHIKNRYADGGAVGGALSMDPTRPVRIPEDDMTYRYYGGYYQTPYSAGDLNDPTWQRMTNTNTPQNPVALLDLKDDRAIARAFVGNIEGDYKIHGFEDLRLHANFGADYSYGKQTTVISPYSYSNNYYGWDGYDQTTKYNLSFNAYALYIKDLGNHYFDVMGGYEWQHFHRKGNSEGSGFYQSTFNDPALAGTPYGVHKNTWATENYLVSFFGRANYTALNRYLLTATLRADGSSRFKAGNRWGLFPSLAFAWKLKEETFLKEIDWLYDLKLRLGYGITGQQDIRQGDYPSLILYSNAKQYAYYTLGEIDPNTGEYIYYAPLRPEAYNLDLTWEKTTTYNAGFDFGFMRGRFTGAIDLYYRLTKDLISDVDISAGTNFKNKIVDNIGSLSNKGVEISLNSVTVHTQKLRWDIGFTATYNTNKIESLTTGKGENYYVATGGISAGVGNNIQRHQEGFPANTFFVYESKVNDRGLWEIVNQDNNENINADDLVPYKKPAPDVMMGLTSKWIYGNFDFSFSLRANIGNYVYYDVRAGKMTSLETIEREGGFTNVLVNTLEPYKRIQGSPNIKANTNAFWLDRFVENASFMRCDNITLGYTFNNSKWNARIYGTVQNPFIITGYTGLDPEISNNGIDRNNYPRALTAILGISLQF